ncbi:MAG TPA: M23 family metallopeptidase [Xanthomonadaceae bacterium]|nr:M23 family metallopeptidase [Xanthomonadaceae bacterium]
MTTSDLQGESRSSRRARLAKLREAALHRKVLAHPAFNGRWTRRHWAHASVFATLGMLVAALVPGFSAPTAAAASTRPGTTTLALALPALPLAQRHGAGDSWQLITVQRGQNLAALFDELGIPAATLHRLLQQPEAKQALTHLKPGAELGFDLPAEGTLRTLRYDRDDTHRVELSLAGDEVRQKVIERPTETRTVVLSGEVGRSLYRSARKLGLPAKAIDTLTDDIFKYDIDFNDDVGASDRFSVVVDQYWRDGQLVGTGPVQAATFTVRGKLYSGFRFEHDGKTEYYTGDGRPLKRSFIRMPIPYARLTSTFGNRFHPVLGRMRMHEGVDFAASTGTPIQAAGDARVAFVGQQHGYGNVVILDHGRGYTTLYGHMSRFGKEHVGQRIAQGTVIGYVGMTGLATGPHLHYEFRVNGVHRNPLSVTMPPPEPLQGAALVAFRAQTTTALAKIRRVEDVIYADAGSPRKANKKA